MNRIEVITDWRQVDGKNLIAVAEDYPATWTDITGQPDAEIIPAPNTFTAEGIVDDATLAAIEADSRYVVLLSEVIVNG